MTPKRSIIPIFVPHLGCPHMCVFCNQRRISGETEPATADEVRKIIDEALKKLPEKYEKSVAFYGGSFTAIPVEEQESLLGAAAPYLESGKIASLRLSTRPDCIDGDTLLRLHRYGVKTVELGVQSMCEDVLLASNRGHTAEDARHASKLIKAAGFELILQQMTGLPCDTPEKSVYTAEEFIKLRPDGVRVYPTVIIKDTELYDLWRAGAYKEHTVEEAAELCATLLDMYEDAGIPVIRLGLNPTDDLSGGDAVGGAYHPALRELCEGKRFLRKELALVSESDEGKLVTFCVPKGQISQAVGQKRCNKEYIVKRFNLRDVKFVEGDIKHGDVKRI